jgi:AcrR family transcriptional regulator
MRSQIYSSVDDAALVERRRQQFVEAAAKLYEHNGFHKTTVKEIAQLAGVSAGLIYSYVKTKEDVLFLVLQSVLESYAREIPKALDGVVDPVERFCSAVRAYCQVVGAKPDATLLAYRETKSLGREQQSAIKDMELKTNQLLIQCIEECVALGYFRATNVELAAYRLVLLAHGWALKSWRFKEFTTLQEYTEEGLDLFLNALLTPAGWSHYRGIERKVANQ